MAYNHHIKVGDCGIVVTIILFIDKVHVDSKRAGSVEPVSSFSLGILKKEVHNHPFTYPTTTSL